MSILRVNEIMIKKKISHKALAEKVGITPTAISYICSGKNNPKLEVLLNIANVLDVDIRELFNPTKGGIVSKDEVIEAKKMIHNGLKILDGLA